ncbi:MAG: hypothetical protein ABEH78_00390 [Haloferacaceae archaeon]
MNARQVPPIDGIARKARLSRYDLYLALLPVPLIVGVLTALTTPTPLPYGAGAGALPSALVLAHGLFRDAPTATAEAAATDRRGAPADD